jgi:hypothetical protein
MTSSILSTDGQTADGVDGRSSGTQRLDARGDHGQRELAFRVADGLEIALLWDVDTHEATVSVYDAVLDRTFTVPAPRERALEVFYHPYAHAARRGIPYELRSR